jgi:HEAT repeat protein
MARPFHALTWAALLLTAGLVGANEEQEPVVLRKPLSEWLTILRSDKQEKSRRGALIALEIVGLQSRKVVPAVAQAARQEEAPAVREAAVVLLGRLAAKAADAAADDASREKEAAREALKPALETLTEVLREDKIARNRSAAATALGRLGSAAKASVPALSAALKDKDDGPRAAAAEALGRLGDDAADAVPALLDAYKDPKADRFLRIYAAFALGRAARGKEGAPEAVTALASTLADAQASPDVRKATAEALGVFGPDAAAAVPALVKALGDKQAVELRRAAAFALDQIRPEAKAVLPDLKAALGDEDKFVRAQILHLIGGLGEGATALVPDVIGRLQADQVTEVRLAAIEALGTLGLKSNDVLAALTAASRSSQTAIRDAALAALKRIQGES